MRRRTVQPEIRSFVSVLRSPQCHTIGQKQNEEWELFRRVQRFLATESVNSAPFKRGETQVQVFGKEKCKSLRQGGAVADGRVSVSRARCVSRRLGR